MVHGIRTSLLVATLAVLVACGDPNAGGGATETYLTPTEAAAQVQGIENDAVSVGNGLVDGVLSEAFATAPTLFDVVAGPYLELAGTPGLIPLMRDDAFSAPRLATGTYTFDDVAGAWTYAATPSNALVARWDAVSADAPAMELTLGWTGTQPVILPSGDEVDGPTGATIRLTEDGTAIVDLTLTQAWRDTTCGRLAEARTLRVSGTAGDAAAGLTFRDLGVTSPADGSWVLGGGVDARSGSLEVSLDLDMTFDVDLVRSATTCFPESASSVDADVAVDLTSPGRSVEFAFDATVQEATNGADVELRAGRFVVGSKRVDFAGSVPAGTPDAAANILLTFADGETSTLGQFLQQFGLLD